jgi:acetylglutamate kinase
VNSGYLPVVACIAGDSKGTIFNVNADQMAVSCAAGWRAGKLIFLTDVPGVKDASGAVARTLNVEQVRELIAAGVAQGGMQAKLEAAILALASGLEEVIIASGNEANVCRRLLAGENLGSRLCATAEAALQ